jgi:hypothetical protein
MKDKTVFLFDVPCTVRFEVVATSETEARERLPRLREQLPDELIDLDYQFEGAKLVGTADY